jgi:hypothetical protein
VVHLGRRAQLIDYTKAWHCPQKSEGRFAILPSTLLADGVADQTIVGVQHHVCIDLAHPGECLLIRETRQKLGCVAYREISRRH